MTKSKGNAGKQQKEENKSKQLVCCRSCIHSRLIQYGTNPVLALCPKKPDGYSKYGMEVDVASSMKYCSMYGECHDEKYIEKLFSVRHHPMACYVRSQTKERVSA